MLQDLTHHQSAPNTEVGFELDTKLKIIAVRLKRFGDAEIAFSANENHIHKRSLIASRIERRDPALRNLAEGMEKFGLQIRVDGCNLYWLLIEDENTLDYYQRKNEVECVFSYTWFEEFKKSIRYFQGMQYVDKCEQLAKEFEIKDQSRKITYHV